MMALKYVLMIIIIFKDLFAVNFTYTTIYYFLLFNVKQTVGFSKNTYW